MTRHVQSIIIITFLLYKYSKNLLLIFLVTFKPRKGSDRQISNEVNKLRIQYTDVPSMCNDDFETFVS